MEITKICTKCYTKYPLTCEYFRKEKNSKDGFRGACKCCDKKRWKNYYENNKEKLKEKNAPFSSERHKKYYSSHKEEYKINLRKRRKERPEVYNTLTLKRNSLKKIALATMTSEDWKNCLKYFDNKDAYTGLLMKTPSQDHVIPVSKGGAYVIQNIVPCDKSINSSKSNKDLETWYKKQSFFSQERLDKIYKWMGVKENIQQLKII